MRDWDSVSRIIRVGYGLRDAKIEKQADPRGMEKVNMKKTLKVSIVLAVAVVFLAGAFLTSRRGDGKIADGTYKVTNSDAYPGACIVVRGNELQFYNIDLNALYQKYQRETYDEWKKRGVGAKLTEEQIEQYSDLNEMYVSNAWYIDYNLTVTSKEGTFTNVYFCKVKDTPFGLILQYDSLHRTIQINNPDPENILIFKKAWGI